MSTSNAITLFDNCAQWQITGADGSTRAIRLSRPLPNAWRLQTADGSGAFHDRGASQLLAEELGEDLGEKRASLRVEGDGQRVSAEGLEGSVEISLDAFRLAFSGSGRSAVLSGLGWQNEELKLSGPLADGEKIWGTGERFNALDQRGKRILMWAMDQWLGIEGNSYMPIPFLLSSAGYGLLVNRFEGMVFDLGAGDASRWLIEELKAPLDLYVFLDDSPLTILESLTQLTGRPPMPPEWGFGMLVSRHGRTKEFTTPEGVLEMAAKMDELDLPWSGAIIEGWPTYDVARYPELRKLAADLHARNKKVMVYDACGRVGRGGQKGSTDSTDYLLKHADGRVDLEESRHYNPADAPNRRESRFVDITNPEAVRWWANEIWGPLLEDVGVDGAKIDFCEQIPEHEDLAAADGRSPRGLHHYYPTKYNTLMHRLFNEKRPDGGLCWSRGGGIGAARYPFLWCGDQLREFQYLRAMLVAALSSGVSGVPFMGQDMSGYMPTKDADANPEPEVFIRGTQMAAFWPMLSTHGTVTRPYDFEKPIVDLYRTWTKIHYALIPYIKEQADICCRTGVPFLRPMCLHYPDDERARAIEDQFFMGEDLLVAPMLTQAESRDVYFPAGNWQDINDGSAVEGPSEAKTVPAPLRTLPFFVTGKPSSSVLANCLVEIRRLLAQS